MKYTIQVSVERASGYQVYEVVAASKEEALKIYNEGGGEYVDQEVEVTELGNPEILEEREE